MSDAAKKKRAKRYSENIKKSEKRKEFNESMKIARLGANNPFSRKVYYYGEIFHTRNSFYEYIKTIGISKNSVIRKLRENTDPNCYLIDRVTDSLSKTIKTN